MLNVSRRFFQRVPAGWHLLLAPFGAYGFEEEKEIRNAVQKIGRHTKVGFERLASLWQQVRYLDKYEIEGSIVECGVWRGGSIGLAALAHQMAARVPTRHLHLFDSFVGLPEPDPEKDGEGGKHWATARPPQGRLEPIGACVAAQKYCRELLEDRIGYPKSLLHYHVGWFQDTLPKANPGPIALLRLDGDWYHSTQICLATLYEQVVEDGVIVIDDYGHFEGCRRAVDEFISASPERIFLSQIDYTGRYWIKKNILK